MSIFYFLNIKNINDITNRLIYYVFKFMKKNIYLKMSQENTNVSI